MYPVILYNDDFFGRNHKHPHFEECSQRWIYLGHAFVKFSKLRFFAIVEPVGLAETILLTTSCGKKSEIHCTFVRSAQALYSMKYISHECLVTCSTTN